MKLVYAFFTHAWLALRFKHDGEGLPIGFPAALALVSLYVLLNATNKTLTEGLDLETLLALSFIAQCYLFGLRNKLIGLLILIGIISNGLALATIYLTGYSPEKIMLISLMEYAMVFSAIINVIKSNFKIS